MPAWARDSGMKITMVGTGYVGLVSGACLAEMGNDVVCLDVDPVKIASLGQGRIPIYEPGLQDMVARNAAAGRLRFTCDAGMATEHGETQFIAVGTPPGEDGSADLRYVLAAARTIGRHMRARTVVVDKSTVPVGTADKVRQAVAEELDARGVSLPFHVVSNPEFLKEGAAIADFMSPDRVVVGADDPYALSVMRRIYQPFQRTHERFMAMDIRSAELTKYAANAMLATRVSFMNEIANLAEQLGADVEQVRRGIGADPRIGYQFLYPGCGYGGSCFPKDVQALMRTAQEHGVPMRVVEAVDAANRAQKFRLAEKIVARCGEDLGGRTFALWGLAFKPNTDDMREAPSLTIVSELTRRGARVRAWDPVAMPEAARVLAGDDGFSCADDMYGALDGADGLLIATEWRDFRSPDFERMRGALARPLIVDGRNLYDPAEMAGLGFAYEGIGRA